MIQERNSRPFTARSVVASLLLGTQPPRLAAAALVRAAAALGCADGTTRVALSRMVAAGELVASDGWYELGGALVARQRRQEAGRHPALRAWDGTWVLAVVGGRGPRTAMERTALRRELTDARLAEWREGVWARPDNLAGSRPAPTGCTWVAGARPEGLAPADLWDLEGWARRGGALLVAMASSVASIHLGDPDGLGAAFELAAAVVRHLRDDPLLPDALLPQADEAGGWPGAELRGAYEGFEAAFRKTLRPVLVDLASSDAQASGAPGLPAPSDPGPETGP